MSWLSRLLHRKASASPAELPAPAPERAPAWAQELLEAVQKSGRAQAKAIARLEALEPKLEGGFADLRSAIGAAARPPADPRGLEDILDALDILDEARRALAASGWTESEQGLAGVAERLERFLGDLGVARRASATEPLDGKLFRVVGTVQRPDLPDGAPTQVVRAAAFLGGRLLREGEVLVNRRPFP
jgi:hypothetical protein